MMDMYDRALEIANKRMDSIKQIMDELDMTDEERAVYMQLHINQLLGLQETVAQYKEEA